MKPVGSSRSCQVFVEFFIGGGYGVRGYGGCEITLSSVNNYSCLILFCNDFFSAISVIDILDAVCSNDENCSSLI